MPSFMVIFLSKPLCAKIWFLHNLMWSHTTTSVFSIAQNMRKRKGISAKKESKRVHPVNFLWPDISFWLHQCFLSLSPNQFSCQKHISIFRCSVDEPSLETLFCSRLSRLSLPRLRSHRTPLYQGTRRRRPQRSRTPRRSRYSGYPGCHLRPLYSGISRPLRPQPHCRLTGEAQYITYQPPRRS